MRLCTKNRYRLFDLSFILLWAASPGAQPFLTGLVPPTPEETAAIRARGVDRTKPIRAAKQLPTSVRALEFLPAVNTQTLPNCGAYAPTYYMKTQQEARRHGWGRVNPWTHPERAMSPGIAYLFGQSDISGGSIGGTITVMCDFGIVPLSMLRDTYDYDRTTFPSATLFLEAARYRGDQPVYFTSRTEDGIRAIKEWLADGELAVFSIPVSEATSNYGRSPNVPGVDNDVIFALGGTSRDGHALTLVGYDDTKTYNDGTGEKRGAFLAVNSWGTTWGVLEPEIGTRGFAWFGYDYFKSTAGEAVYSITPRPLEEPRVVGIFDYAHPYSPQVTMQFFGGTVAAPDALSRFPPANPSENASYLHPMLVDLTGRDGMDPESFLWRNFNVGRIPGLPQPAALGTARAFRVMSYQNARAALEGPLFVPGTDYEWRIVPMSQITGPALDAEGLPRESVYLPSFTDVAVGLMDKGEVPFDSGASWGDATFADLNRDGRPDMVVASWKVTGILENIGGGFRPVEGHGLPSLSYGAVAVGDYDRDGLPDLALCGYLDELVVTRVYRNEGNLRFRDIGANIPGVSGGILLRAASIAWGDYDNDGLEDLAQWGSDADRSQRVQVHRNLGNGSFEPAPFTFPEYDGARVGWHDVNADGLMDLCAGTDVFVNQGLGRLSETPINGFAYNGIWGDFTGDGFPDCIGVSNAQQVQLYRNDGSGALAAQGPPIEQTRYHRFQCVDYNNDGRLDLVSSHYTAGSDWIGGKSPRATVLFRQMPDSTLRDAGHQLLATSEGAVATADVDGDGDLDLLTSGLVQVASGPMGHESRLHRSLVAQSPLGPRPNTRPTVPGNLRVSHQQQDGVTYLRWDPASDAESPTATLGYNVRVGTRHGGNDIHSSATSAPVSSVVRQYRLTPDQPGLMLRGLEPGFYSWSVRTVDQGREASAWAPEHRFVIGEGFAPQDLNYDRIFDSADLCEFGMLIEDSADTLPLTHDFNADASICQGDQGTLARRLVGSPAVVPGSYEIGDEGGRIDLDGFSLVVPPGAFRTTTRLRVERVAADTSFGQSLAPRMFRIAGLPAATAGACRVELRSHLVGENPHLLVGERVFARGAAAEEMHWRIETPEFLPNDLLGLSLPPLDPASLGVMERNSETYELNLGVLGGYATLSGQHFSIGFPKVYVGDAVETLMAGLETGHRVIRDDLGFSYAARTRWPISVCVRDMGPDIDGATLPSLLGDNYTSIEVNSRILGDLDRVRITGLHEFFHVVQALYDPRGRWAKAKNMARHYWVDEATATWAEELAVANPAAYIPGTYMDNAGAPYRGVAVGIAGPGGVAQDYGYGMAAIVKYLVKRDGKGVPLAMYTEIRRGGDSVEALRAALPGSMIMIWFNQFLSDLVENKVYPMTLVQFASTVESSRRYTLKPEDQASWRRFDVSMTDLGAVPHILGFRNNYPTPPQGALLAVRLDAGSRADLQIFKASNTESAVRIASCLGTEEVKFLTVPDASLYKTQDRRLVAVASNSRDDSPYRNETKGTLSLGWAMPGPFPIGPHSTTAQAFGRGFPTFSASGSLQAEAISDFKDYQGTLLFPTVEGAPWGGEKVPLTISYTATMQGLTDTWEEDGGTHSLTTSGISRYILLRSDGSGNVLETLTSGSGTFTLELTREDRDRGFAILDIRAVYPLTYSVPGQAPIAMEAEWPILFLVFTLP